MFTKTKDTKTKTNQPIYKPGANLKVLKAARLFAHPSYQTLFDAIQKLSELSSEYFQAFYGDLINRFGEFVQVVPKQADAYLGSLLNTALMRAYNGLYHYRERKSQDGVFATQNPLLAYAIFTSALFYDLQSFMVNQRFFITDTVGIAEKEWYPTKGSLIDANASFYKIRFSSGNLHRAIIPILARQLLSQDAFDWIASDREIFHDWLCALQDEPLLGGQVSDALAYLKNEENWIFEFGDLPISDIEQTETPETEIGEEFLKWLQDGLANGRIPYNSADSAVHRVAGGVFFQVAELYQAFLKDVYNNEKIMNHDVLYRQLGYLFGIIRRTGYYWHDRLVSGYETGNAEARSQFSFTSQLGKNAQKSLQGVLIKDPGLIFKNTIPVQSTYLKASPATSKELITLPNLAQNTGQNPESIFRG